MLAAPSAEPATPAAAAAAVANLETTRDRAHAETFALVDADLRALDDALLEVDALGAISSDRWSLVACRLADLGRVEWLEYSESNGGGGRWVATAGGEECLLDICEERGLVFRA